MYVCMSDTEKSRFKSNQIFITQRHLGKRKRSDKMERACRNETEEMMKIKYSERREDTEGQKRCGRRVWEKERDEGKQSKTERRLWQQDDQDEKKTEPEVTTKVMKSTEMIGGDD